MIPSSFLDALFPELSRSVSEREGRMRLQRLYRHGRKALWLAVPVLVVPFQIAASFLIPLLYGSAFDTAIPVVVFRVLMIAFPFTYLYLLNGHLLYAIGQQRWVTGVMVLVTAVKALCNALLVPGWSYWGAVTVALSSEILLFALLRFVVQRYALCRVRSGNV